MAARKPLIAGNWKMHGRKADLGEAAALEGAVGAALARVEVLICPPAPYIEAAVRAVGRGGVIVGAQDCSSVAADAARTGEVSAAMLADAGARYVIVGHSERRTLLGETDEVVRQKAQATQAAGLAPIVCVGETQAQREAGQAAAIVAGQIRASAPGACDRLVVAYEPVWAIGASRTPTLHEIAEIHAVAREELTARYGTAAENVRVLYGGSVNPKNAGEIFAVEDVDGALVGRASLKASDFSAIITAHPAAL